MRTPVLAMYGCVLLVTSARAEVAPVVVHAPKAKAWIGQRVSFFVKLRARGSFVGTASFDVPQLPGALMMKIGNPVVGSENLEEQSWITQTHEFALFTQKAGLLEVPPFAVSFTSREGFIGPVKDTEAQVPGWQVDIRRPPGSEQIGFLITTESFLITEKWEPVPGTVQVGTMFRRTIIQRASQVPGMMLAPVPTAVPDGIRVYPGVADTEDRLERGDFLGERRDIITYLLQKPGMLALPALTYHWWNPETEQLESTTLPAVTFEVTPAPVIPAPGQAVAGGRSWPWLLIAAVAVGLGAWQSRHIAELMNLFRGMLNPPDLVAARNLLRACRRDDAAAAQTSWIAWRNTQDSVLQPNPELHHAILGLQQYLFGPASSVPWSGDELARAFGKHLTDTKIRSARQTVSVLPVLNPQQRVC